MNEPHDPLFAVQRRSGNRNKTVYWELDLLEDAASDSVVLQPNEENKLAIVEAATMLREGGTVAFPTETVYGLGADARNTAAVEAVFAAKGRPSDNPLIVHIADSGALDELVTEVHPTAAVLMDAYWPGPLTVVLPVREGVLSPCVTAGLDTVGVRMPDHPVALALISAAGCPVAAPSANRSGRPSPTLASHVMEDLAGYIDGVLDGGAAGVGLESTVVQVQPDGKVAVLRPGGITTEQLAAVVGAEAVAAEPAVVKESGTSAAAEAPAANEPGVYHGAEAVSDSLAPRAPGMKYTHYAPRGWLGVVSGSSPQRVADEAASLLQAAQLSGEVTGLLLFEEHKSLYPAAPAACVLSLGSLSSPEEGARSLYAALRRFDEAGATYILAEACPYTGLGAAIMNRLMKAAGGSVIDAG
ncbi:L-threonylcarbamoyladenylate synthase [Paenibacillus sp. FSL K6-3166]|jgi:L-threonylcarbamoyladenylate synthase|uniref:L-threonylcarbamoyladenylate synthase n=1 Tax=unclassified Paenibacillus TaxID=185978 RepID=UPI000BA104CB|nr:L-threonylcarbamoyladenylate synthase [Paenibacillus sp. VTT E-133291]OZQ84882.1 threonylcarbamoyl-AMP synthase [Paenibacillus sp. VTT E-133291]